MNATDTNTQEQTPTKVDTPAAKPAPKKAGKSKPKAKAAAKKAAKPAKKAKAKKGDKTPEGPAALKRYAPEYHKDNEKKTAGGNTSVDNDDDVAKKLRGKDLDAVYAFVGPVVSKATDGDENEKTLRKKYGHLNVGMQRMNLGNKLRGIYNAK